MNRAANNLFPTNKQVIGTMLVCALVILALMACESVAPSGSANIYAYATFTPSPLTGNYPDAAYAAAATLASGQNELAEVSQQETRVSLDMDQSANAAAQATLDYNQRQLMELSIKGTEISQNMAQAEATQQFIVEQTQMAWNTTATAESQAATATYSAYILNVTQTAQAQANLNAQATQTAQVNAALASYSLTATPWAAMQVEIDRARNEADRRALWSEFVVTPLTVILFTLVIILLIAGGIIAFRQLMPVLELRMRTISRNDDSTYLLVDRRIIDVQGELNPPKLPSFPSTEMPQVEIIGPSDPSIVNWITEAEQQLRSDRRDQP